MEYKKVLTIQDISCVGQCSLTVALPILSACGLETAILPSAILSTHTAGFTGYTFRDLTDDIPGIVDHWRREGIGFDAIYSGYLGSARQIEYVKAIMASMGKPGCISTADPAMADNGRLYPAFDMAYVFEMKSLCAAADIILPNITEACFLTGTEYREAYTEDYTIGLLDKLEAMGCRSIVLTGVGYAPGSTGVLVRSDGGTRHYEHRLIPGGCHGTGDIFASAFVGALTRGKPIFDAARIAADYTVLCIENTQGDSSHWYGAKFETALPQLMEMLA